MIEAILFDFGQTLVESSEGFRIAEHDAQSKIFAEFDGCAWDELINGYRRTRSTTKSVTILARRNLADDIKDKKFYRVGVARRVSE